jgi:flagellar hook protein FlgE
MMNSIYDIAMSGMMAAQAALGATANNIANSQTPGYQAQYVDMVDLSGGGVAISGTSTDGDGSGDDSQGNDVDLASQMTDMMKEKFMYTANAEVINVANQMTGSLLDMFDNQRQSSG